MPNMDYGLISAGLIMIIKRNTFSKRMVATMVLPNLPGRNSIVFSLRSRQDGVFRRKISGRDLKKLSMT
ncbi:hypothetical protein D3C87_2058490 [compost metagenome]